MGAAGGRWPLQGVTGRWLPPVVAAALQRRFRPHHFIGSSCAMTPCGPGPAAVVDLPRHREAAGPRPRAPRRRKMIRESRAVDHEQSMRL